MIKEKERATRSDKKIDCKPTISINLKECIYRLSYITNTPVKNVAEEICKAGIRSRRVIEHLSNHFRRNFRLDSTVYIGDLKRPSLQRIRYRGETDRITIRFMQQDFELITALAYALDVTPSKATAILLESSIKDTNFINRFTRNYISGQLDQSRMKELKKVLSYINQNNPYEEKISWAALLSFLYDELKTSANTMTNALNNWIDKIK